MSKRLILAALLLPPLSAAAQELVIPEVRYPVLPPLGAGADAFAPPGWQVERQARGDLDGDGLADLAFVIRMRDPANILSHELLGSNPFDTNPRILAVALATSDGALRLVVQDHVLIPRREYPNQEDPAAPDDTIFTIERGSLGVSLYRFSSAGGWDAGQTRFTFRWQDGALRLIGFDYANVRRNTLCSTSLSVNFLTRRARLGAGYADEDEREEVRWRRLPASPLRTIAEVGDGLAFDPEQLISGFPLDCRIRDE